MPKPLFGLRHSFDIWHEDFGIFLLASASTLPPDLARLHGALVPAAGTTAFAAPAISTGLLAASTLTALVCAATAAASIGVLSSSVACHIVLLIADIFRK